MKTFALFLILSLAACVDEVDTSDTDTAAAVAPDAGVDEESDLTLPIKKLTASGRKGGETMPCNCD